MYILIVHVKKEMSSFDVHSIVNEMIPLVGSHVDNVFQWGSNILLRVNVSGKGKRNIFFKERKWLYLPEKKPETPDVSQSFAMFLKKHISNARIGKIYQIGFDRIVVVEVLKANFDYKIIFEMFGGGNVLLTLDGKILNCIVCKSLKDRSIKPGEIYRPPKSRFNPVLSSFEEFALIVKSSEADIVRTLATGVNLGGQYAEEVCIRSGILKNTKVFSLDNDDIKKLFDSVKNVIAQMINSSFAVIYSNDKEIVDVTPINMNIYGRFHMEEYDSFSKAMDKYIDDMEKHTDVEILKLQKRINKQEEAVKQYREGARELREEANAIYTNYQPIDELLKILCIQSQKLSWDKLKESAMKVSFVSEVDPSTSSITVVFDNLRIPLDYTKKIDANASSLYARSKEISDKASRADIALKESVEVLNKKQIEMSSAVAVTKFRPTKRFWFERYKWFILPSGRMAIAGKDAHTNDDVVKKHMEEGDIYVHADIHGAPSVILKEGKGSPKEDLREVCTFALAHSKSWTTAFSDGSAYWVYPDQVSKTPQAGEFIPRGAFIIRGKRNYEFRLPIELAVGEIKFEGVRKVMCGPLQSVQKLSSKYFVIRPKKDKVEKISALMADEFQVPEEEVSRVLPPGNSEIVSKVWIGIENDQT
ncbi:MAG: NFACT family protein [archaeon]|nr:NFACT family protein [archaeon]